MTTQASKHPKGKSKARKLKLNKETLKDLDPNNTSQVKGGAAPVTGKPTCFVRLCP
jgi:hypothetical protein